MSESSKYMIEEMEKRVKVIVDEIDTPIVWLSKKDRMTQLMATNIGDAAPFPWIVPCRGNEGVLM